MSGPERHTEPDRGFGRDGISGLVDANRALRARDVSRPGPEELEAADRVPWPLPSRDWSAPAADGHHRGYVERGSLRLVASQHRGVSEAPNTPSL